MKNIMEIFKEKVDIVMDKPAIYFNDKTLTYNELDILSDNLSKYIIELGVKKNSIIPIICEPSIDRMVIIFAILKAGAAYLPIPVDSTKERIEYLIEDSYAKFIITDRTICTEQNVGIININNLEYKNQNDKKIKIRKGNIAYVIYTSGSTGNPKGVKVSHDSLIYILNNMQKYYGVKPNDKYLLNTPYSFDVSVVEIFGWILGEGSLVISELETKKKYSDLIDIIDRYSITHLSFSPSIIRLVYELFSDKDIEVINKNVKYLMFAGEEFQYEYAKKTLILFKNVQIANLYGPTEATVYATRYDIDETILDKNYIPIGVPFDGANIKIMDENGQEVKKGEKGEIYIYGEGVSLGYHNNLTMNKEKFGISSSDERFYRTGDIGEIDKDGNIKFFGRYDNQVQIHGIRVELGEIENVLLRIKGIKGACVVYEKNQLIAFIEGKNNLSKEFIKNELFKKLPKYMVPNLIELVQDIPLNTNRKVDKKQLISSINKKSNSFIGKEILEGRELTISELFNNVLKIKVNNSLQDFFELGGDSLNGIHLLSLLEKEFDMEFRNDFLYSYSTIKAISEYITRQEEIEGSQIYNIDDCSIDREYINEELSHSYEENSNNIRSGRLIKKNSFFFQRVYRNIKFDSKINAEIFIDKNISIEKINQSIIELINDNFVLRVFLKEEDNKVVFLENNHINSYSLAHCKINCESNKNNKYQEIIKEELNNSLKIYNDKYLLYNIVLVEYLDGYTLTFALDHNIADLSCVHILKKKFNNLIKGNRLKKHIDYNEFIEITEENNKDNVLLNKYTIKVDKANKGVDKKKLNKFDNEILILKKSIEVINTNEWYINEASYIVGQIGCSIFEASSVCINVILNLRKIKKMDLSELVGDVHTVGTMIVNQNDRKAQYEKYIEKEFDKFYIDNGLNPMHVIYKDLPDKNEYQQQVEKTYVSDIPINLNYVGQIKEKEVNNFYKNLKKTKEKLDKFEAKMLKTTVVTTEKNMYIFLLKKPSVDEKLLKKMCLEEISI